MTEEFDVNKVSHWLPVSVEELIDAGHPPPPGYVAPTPPRIKRRHRLLWWIQDKRRQFGFWIAGEADD